MTKTAKSAAWPAGCSRKKYIEATTKHLLQDTPERRSELLGSLSKEWRADFDREVARQTAEAKA